MSARAGRIRIMAKLLQRARKNTRNNERLKTQNIRLLARLSSLRSENEAALLERNEAIRSANEAHRSEYAALLSENAANQKAIETFLSRNEALKRNTELLIENASQKSEIQELKRTRHD